LTKSNDDEVSGVTVNKVSEEEALLALFLFNEEVLSAIVVLTFFAFSIAAATFK
jgi:hypothetical protein